MPVRVLSLLLLLIPQRATMIFLRQSIGKESLLLTDLSNTSVLAMTCSSQQITRPKFPPPTSANIYIYTYIYI